MWFALRMETKFENQKKYVSFLQSHAHFQLWDMVWHKLIGQQYMEDILKTPQQILPVIMVMY